MPTTKLDPISLALRNAAMLREREQGKSSKELAEEYGLNAGQVNRILAQERKKPKPSTETTTKEFPELSRKADAKAAKSNGKPRSGCLEAAILMLRDMHPATAMRPAEIIAELASRKLWKSPEGKTPDQTLWARILGEIKRGREPRLRKVSPGRFGLTKAGRE